MTLNNLLTKLDCNMNCSPFNNVPLLIMQGRTMICGTYRDEHIRQLIIKQPYVKRWAVYNDESEIMIELEG